MAEHSAILGRSPIVEAAILLLMLSLGGAGRGRAGRGLSGAP